jgi:hypothetical protein
MGSPTMLLRCWVPWGNTPDITLTLGYHTCISLLVWFTWQCYYHDVTMYTWFQWYGEGYVSDVRWSTLHCWWCLSLMGTISNLFFQSWLLCLPMTYDESSQVLVRVQWCWRVFWQVIPMWVTMLWGGLGRVDWWLWHLWLSDMSGNGILACFTCGDTFYGNCCGDGMVTYLTCGDTQLTCFRVDDTCCGNHCGDGLLICLVCLLTCLICFTYSCCCCQIHCSGGGNG